MVVVKQKAKTNYAALGIIAVVAAGVLFFGNAYNKGVTNDAQKAGAGVVAGVESVQQEATLTINNGKTTRSMVMTLNPGVSALDLVIRAGMRENFTVETKKYDFGTIVESIDGVRGGDQKKYWLYYVNGKQATVGADAYKVQSGDTIDFRFE